MIRKWTLLILVMAFSFLTACGGSDSEAEGTNVEKEVTNSNGFEELTLSLGHVVPATDDAHYHQGALVFKEIVEEKTGGKITIEIHPNGVLGAEREMVEAVQLGTLDMVITSTGPISNFVPISRAFDFPFLFRDRDHAYKVLDGEIGSEVSEQLIAADFKVLAWMENGYRMMTNNTRPIVNPKDMEGIKMRTMENPIHIASFEAFGANPTPMAYTELYSALQQGVVDGQDNALSGTIPVKFHEVQDYLTLSAHFYSPAPFMVNEEKFNSFSPELQKIIEDAAIEARDFERTFNADMDEAYLQAAIDEGVEVVTEDEFNYDAFFEAAQPIYEQHEVEFGEIHKRIMEVE